MSMTALALSITDEQRGELGRMAVSTSLPHRQVVQARALLWAADGLANEEIARRCEVDSDAVRRWRSRFAEKGVDAVGIIAKGRGRKPSLPAGTVEEVLQLIHRERPADGSTQWSTRSMAGDRQGRRGADLGAIRGIDSFDQGGNWFADR